MSRSSRFLLLAGAVTVLGFGAQLVPDLLGRIPLFDLRSVEFRGLVYLDPAEAEALVRIPEGHSIWDDSSPLLRGLDDHPLVREARVNRRFPSGVTIEVEERSPVALAVGPTLQPVDHEGRPLPIDPAGHRLDLPLLHVGDGEAADSSDAPGDETGDDGLPERRTRILATELRRIEELEPRLSAAISEIELDRWDEVILTLASPQVRLYYDPPITSVRMREALLVLDDAVDRASDRRLLAVDLRFADQVVARYDSPPAR